MAEREGVIKFVLEHREAPVDADVAALNAWRGILVRLGHIGQDPGRYEGLGFGNLSQRTPAGFLISGSQTGHIEETTIANYAEVTAWSVPDNKVCSRGLVPPSSESMTHAAIYGADEAVNHVFHAHAPEIWRFAPHLDIAATPDDVAYGTVAMAEALDDAVRLQGSAGIVVMPGHEDGVIAWATSAPGAGHLLIDD